MGLGFIPPHTGRKRSPIWIGLEWPLLLSKVVSSIPTYRFPIQFSFIVLIYSSRQKSSVFCSWWGFESTENVDLEEVWDWVLYSSWQLQHSQYNDVTKAYQCVLYRWYWIQNICVKVTKFNYVCKREAIRSIQCLMPKAWFSVRHMHKHNWAQGHHSEDAHHTSISTSTNGTNVFVLSCAYPYVKWERFAVSTSINRDNCFPIKVW